MEPRWQTDRAPSDKPSLVDLQGLSDAAVVARLSAVCGTLPARWLVVDVGSPRTWRPELLAALADVDAALAPVDGRCAVVARGAGTVAVDAGLLWSGSREAALAALSAQGAALAVTVQRERGELRAILRGHVDLGDRFVLDTQLAPVAALAAQHSRIVLDMRGLRFIDVGSLRSLCALERDCRLAGATVVVMPAEGPVRRAITVLSDLAEPERALPTPATPSDGAGLALDPVSAASDDAVIVTDLDGRVTAWNEAAERLYGWTAVEVISRPIGELTVGPRDQRVAEEIMQAIQATGSWEGEFTVHRRDGTALLAHVRDALVRDADGRPIGVRGHSHPVLRPQRARRAA